MLVAVCNRAGSVSRDREILCVFFDATNQVKKRQELASVSGMGIVEEVCWKDTNGWKSSEAMEEWYGVTTNAEGRVIGLDLKGNGLEGTTCFHIM